MINAVSRESVAACRLTNPEWIRGIMLLALVSNNACARKRFCKLWEISDPNATVASKMDSTSGSEMGLGVTF